MIQYYAKVDGKLTELETLEPGCWINISPPFSHEELEEVVLAAEQTNDPDTRKELYSKALGRIADQAYWAPLFSYSANYLVSPDLNFPLDPDGLPRLQNASWK